MQQARNNIYLLAADKLVNGGAAAVSLYLLANHLPLDLYGSYQYALSIASILAVAINLIDEKIVKRRFLSICPRSLLKFISSIKLLIIIALFFCINGARYFDFIDETLYCLASVFYMYFDYDNRSDIRLKASLTGQLTNLVVMYLLVMASAPIIFFAAGTIVSSVASLVIFLKFAPLLPKASKKLNLNQKNKKALLIESIPFGLATIAHIIYYRLDLVMVGWLLDYSEAGIYSAGSQVISLSILFIYPVQTALFKTFSKTHLESKKDFYAYYLSITRTMTVVGALISIGVWLSFDLFRSILLPEHFQRIDEFLWILLIGTVVQYNACMRSSFLVLEEKGVLLLYFQCLALALNIMLNYLLIPVIGLQGASLATLTSITFNLFLANLLHPLTRPLIKLQLLLRARNV